ncbi:extracellular solute-binding protein [Enterococcus asini]|uniref:ABC transporter substrate-binding protein n=1 Tax=Enterococcus asini TaxID=57732 RepID=UPI002890513E|nr:extracellular solute-binding protein [Enterococcus asini]MDT2763722.1 extracellular solute-binding protein [Enterococcus asini]
MKKFSKVLICALGMLALSACGKGGSASKDQVELTVWGDADNQAVHESAFTKLNEAFEKKNPNVKLNYQFSGTLDSINVAVQSDSLPDLFWVQGNKSTKMAEMAKNGYLLPIEGLNYDRFSEESIEYATVDGKIYSSLPSFISYVTYFYNKDIFEKNGLKEPSTWEEFTALVDKLKEREITPIALGGSGDFDRYWYIQTTAASLASKDINSIVENKSSASFEQLKETFQNFYNFSKNSDFGKDFSSTDGNGAKLLFTNGKAAMIPDGTWNSKSYFESGLNIGTFALPGKDGKKYAQTGPSNINTYAISKKTKHPEEATKYIEFLNSKEAQQIIEDETGEVPMMDDITPKDDQVKDLADFEEVGANIYNKLSQVASESSKPQDLLLTSLLPDLMQAKITPDEAINLLKTELEK